MESAVGEAVPIELAAEVIVTPDGAEAVADEPRESEEKA